MTAVTTPNPESHAVNGGDAIIGESAMNGASAAGGEAASLAAILGATIRTSERRNTTSGALFLLDRQPLWADVDVDALGRLLVGLIEFVTEHGDRNHERADDK